jgi:hypothetical protein
MENGNKYPWTPAKETHIGRLARFADRTGDDWSYGMLIGIERFTDGEVVYRMSQMDNDDVQEDFFFCQVQGYLDCDLLITCNAVMSLIEGNWCDAAAEQLRAAIIAAEEKLNVG